MSAPVRDVRSGAPTTDDATRAREAVLTHDGTLQIVVAGALADRVGEWLPRSLRLGAPVEMGDDVTTAVGARSARIVVREDDADALPAPAGAPMLRFAGVGLWREDGDAMVLVGEPATVGIRGRIDLRARCATLRVRRDANDAALRVALPAALTLAAAYLLGRGARALLHAAALVAPDGRAWLLVGDSHAGKSTTCATLLDAGWGYCADDHVIVAAGSGGALVVEGWPRVLHLDRGWDVGTPAGGARDDVDALARWPRGWRRTAPLAGVLLPRVESERPTALEPVSSAARLAALVRQSPWLLGDPAAAPTLLALLARVAALPGAALRLGTDSFHRADRLAQSLAPLVDAADAHRASAR